MALWETRFEDVDATRLQSLADQDVLEGLRIEYKAAIDIATPDGKRNFLKAISAFANSVGGDLVIGMGAQGGHPTGLVVASNAPDADKLRLENVARDNVEPRIHGLRTKEIPLPAGGYALVVRVPQSLNPPHRVTFGGMNKFYGRNSAGTYELGIEELRRLFTVAPGLAEKVRDFRALRMMRIVADQTSVALKAGMRIVVHIVPLQLFSEGRNRSLLAAAAERWTAFVPPGARTDSSRRFNIDGMFTVPHPDGAGDGYLAYAHLFATGALESVSVDADDQGHSAEYVLRLAETTIVGDVLHFGRALRSCGARGPYAILAIVVHVQSLTNIVKNLPGSALGRGFDREDVHCGEVVVDEIPGEPSICASALRDLLDELGNAAGFERSPNFTPDGRWMLRPRF
jgi:hypothetical protein